MIVNVNVLVLWIGHAQKTLFWIKILANVIAIEDQNIAMLRWSGVMINAIVLVLKKIAHFLSYGTMIFVDAHARLTGHVLLIILLIQKPANVDVIQ